MLSKNLAFGFKTFLTVSLNGLDKTSLKSFLYKKGIFLSKFFSWNSIFSKSTKISCQKPFSYQNLKDGKASKNSWAIIFTGNSLLVLSLDKAIIADLCQIISKLIYLHFI